MKNKEISGILYKLADLLDVEGDLFKPRAYRRAAQSIETLEKNIAYYYKENKLEEIPGVGKHISEKIKEYFETGKIKSYEKLKKEIKVNVEELRKIKGLGPKTIKLLYEELNIKNLKELKKAATQGKIAKIKHLGEKTEKNILENIELIKDNSERMFYADAKKLSELIIKELKKLKEVKKIEVAGSLRRKEKTIGDIDILITSNNAEKVMNYFCSLKIAKKVLAKGSTKSVILLENNKEVDLRVVKNEEFGAALNYFTGNKQHNIKLRNLAIKKGLRLNEYGLFEVKTGKVIASKTEKEIYKALGLKYIKPELRKD